MNPIAKHQNIMKLHNIDGLIFFPLFKLIWKSEYYIMKLQKLQQVLYKALLRLPTHVRRANISEWTPQPKSLMYLLKGVLLIEVL